MVLLRRQSSENQDKMRQQQQQSSSAFDYGYGIGNSSNNNYDPEYNTDIKKDVKKPPNLGRRANSLPSPTSSSSSSFFSSESSRTASSSSTPSYSYPEPTSSTSSSSSSSSSSVLWRLFNSAQCFILIYTIYTVFVTHTELSAKLSQLETLNEKYLSAHEDYIVRVEDLAAVQKDFVEMRLQLHAIVPQMKEQSENARARSNNANASPNNDVADVLVKRHDAMSDRMEALQKAIQDIDRLELETRYGRGPYTIEVAVEVEGQRHYFDIETAPNDLVPHSIRTFMDLVEKKVWDDTVLYHQVEHVVVGVPVTLNGIPKNPEIAKGLVFAEYSEKFPHERSTVGFQGSPGGPQFYINLNDNVRIHGPGGQQYQDMFEEADACFGKVRNAGALLEKFKELNLRALQSKNGVYYTKIESMRFVVRT